MSAIVGFVGLVGQSAAITDLVRMTEAVQHRGPDGQATWLDGPAGLGHCMLHTTEESLGASLPFERDGIAITADARIDNRDELIAALGPDGNRAPLTSDAELILAAYARWGEQCPSRLLGDFAFAIWDNKRQTLFCARDCLGVRPFYYHFSKNFFAFGSEIKALFALPGVPVQINEVRIGDYLTSLPADKAITFYEDILRLPPAHSLTANRLDGVRLRQYWSLDFARSIERSSSDEIAEMYRAMFEDAVGSRLRSAMPVGSALSGGLDSSSIVCVARDMLRRSGRPTLKTFSGVFDDVPDSDERPYIEAVVAQGGIEPHFVRADQISPLVDLERVLWHQEEPIWTPNLFMHWGLYKAAQQEGVRVFLDGFLGDNVVGHGWEHLMDLAYEGRWVRLWKEIGGVARRQTGFARGRMIWRYLAENAFKPRLNSLIRWRNRRSQAAGSATASFSTLINPEFAKRIGLRDRHEALQPLQLTPPGIAKKRHYRDLIAGEIPLGLEISNKIASAFSLEARYPFADRRLAEFCLAIPAGERIQDGWSRMFVRRALADCLPEKVCWRAGKGDLSHNFRQSLLKFEAERMDEVFFGGSRQLDPYLALEQLRGAYRSYKKRPDTGNIQAVWCAANLALWLERATRRENRTSPRTRDRREKFTLT